MQDALAVQAMGERFEAVAVLRRPGCRLGVAGELGDTEAAGPAGWRGNPGPLLAVRVRGELLRSAGLRDGDYLLVDRRARVQEGRTVLAEIDGQPRVQRFRRGAGIEVVGAVVGMVRRRGFAGAERRGRAARTAALGQTLQALGRTYAATDNARLRRALLEEVGRVRQAIRLEHARRRRGDRPCRSQQASFPALISQANDSG